LEDEEAVMNPPSVAFDRPGKPIKSTADAGYMTNATDRLLADVRALAPEITRRAGEIEAARRVPLDLVQKLRSIGIFRALVPRSHGGLELDMPAAIRIMEAVCEIDGSVGWASVIGMGCAILAPRLPREVYEQIYRKGPDTIIAASTQPAGTAEAVEGGWRVSGRWPFASGCQHADWMFGLCMMTKDGKTLPEPTGGAPMIRGVMLPASDWQIEDTWYVAGLEGSGSHHITLKDKVVPEAHFFDLAGGPACMPGPLYEASRHFIPLMHFAAALGVAEGALDELVELANTGRQQQRTTVPMRDSELFQQALGRIEAELKAARAYAEAQTESHWRHALAGTLRVDALFTQAGQAATWVTAACVGIVDECFRLGGSTALYETSPLQRRLRDIHAMAQHAMVHQRNHGSAGKVLLDSSRAAPIIRVN
jgi:alkylation response protein AidB-like acyl-CoA dehydrogenase